MAPLQDLLNEIPRPYRPRFSEIVELTDAFCRQLLNQDYKLLCRRMTSTLCRPRAPLLKGRAEGWACGVVHAVGFVNFLHDAQRAPYVSPTELAEGFGVSISTMSAKSRWIRGDLSLIPYHPEWCLPSLLAENPLVWMVEVNGVAMDARRAPRELQEVAFDQGLIPYIPADRCRCDNGYEDEDGRVLGRIPRADGR